MNEKFHYLCHHSFIFIPWIVLAPRRSKGCKPQRRATGANACPTPLSWLTGAGGAWRSFFGGIVPYVPSIHGHLGAFMKCAVALMMFASVDVFFPHPFFQVESLGMVDGRLQHPFLQASIYDRRKITEFLAEHMSHVEHHLSMGCNDHPAKDERKQVILYNSYEQKNMFFMNSSINCFFFP